MLNEPLDAWRLFFIALLVAGIIGLKLYPGINRTWMMSVNMERQGYRMAWIYLLISGFGEVGGVTFMKLSDGFKRWNSCRKPKLFQDAVVPLAGFLFCLTIWLNLATPAKVAGAVWFIVGITYDAIITRGFRVQPATIDFSE